jgi:signal transduction histidine kinase
MTIKLFGQLSHELKTPLNLIFSALQMQKPYINKVDLKTDDKQTRYTKIIKQNSYRLLRIINNLIDMTKIDANSFDIKVQNVDIVNVVREIVLSVENYIEEQERDFIFESSINKKIIACAPFEIERIILNLLSNAVKFTDYGDKIIVKIFDNKKNIYISVKDTGIGIKEEKQQYVFKEFKQADNSLTRNPEGSGLGLSIVKFLVEMHGGSINLESTHGKGSEFTISLPSRGLTVEEDNEVDNNLVNNDKMERIRIEFSDIYNI